MSPKLLPLLVAILLATAWVGLTDLEARYAAEDRV